MHDVQNRVKSSETRPGFQLSLFINSVIMALEPEQEAGALELCIFNGAGAGAGAGSLSEIQIEQELKPVV
ncbi:unnamed protein product [Clavelina lepadiformis]|uniref:Uncharacterized protein n=1 Tax=Clavelina lepadiformis TaxID=159417 RepID=A0ABP0GCS9_CLALP